MLKQRRLQGKIYEARELLTEESEKSLDKVTEYADIVDNSDERILMIASIAVESAIGSLGGIKKPFLP